MHLQLLAHAPQLQEGRHVHAAVAGDVQRVPPASFSLSLFLLFFLVYYHFMCLCNYLVAFFSIYQSSFLSAGASGFWHHG